MKALCITAAIALTFSGVAFAKGGSKSSAGADASAHSSAQISAADCEQLSVASAKAACLRSARAGVGGDAGAAVGATGDTAGARGLIQGGANTPDGAARGSGPGGTPAIVPPSPTGDRGKIN